VRTTVFYSRCSVVKNGTDKVRKNKNAQKGMKKKRTYVPPKFANSQQEEEKKKEIIMAMKPHQEENDELWVRERIVAPHKAFEDIVWEVQHGKKKTWRMASFFKPW
jgi:hypothetical protein